MPIYGWRSNCIKYCNVPEMVDLQFTYTYNVVFKVLLRLSVITFFWPSAWLTRCSVFFFFNIKVFAVKPFSLIIKFRIFWEQTAAQPLHNKKGYVLLFLFVTLQILNPISEVYSTYNFWCHLVFHRMYNNKLSLGKCICR